MLRVLPVSDFLAIVNELLKTLAEQQPFAVEGEVSGYRVSQGQWVSFDLKDEKGMVNVFLPVWKQNVPVEDGMKVRIHGVGRIYPKYGKFSLSAERIEPVGEGALKKALAALRLKLEKEGLFDPSRKRALPRFPERVALIASRESAAYGDFIRILNERWGGVEVDSYHVKVQGEGAAATVTAALKQAEQGNYDAIVITRGGGGFEELMAFNDELLVRAIHASAIPTLVAIGHERDVTLAEEAADVRGSTPTDCARRLVPDREEVLYELASLQGAIENELLQWFDRGHTLIDRALQAPAVWLSGRKGLIDARLNSLDAAVSGWLRDLQERTQSHTRLLASLDPTAVLKRGYSILRNANGQALTSVKSLKTGQDATVTLRDGSAHVTVTNVGEQQLQPKLL